MIPAGFKMGQSDATWLEVPPTESWFCSHGPVRCSEPAAYRRNGEGACADHAVIMGALVPDVPVAAETTECQRVESMIAAAVKLERMALAAAESELATLREQLRAASERASEAESKLELTSRLLKSTNDKAGSLEDRLGEALARASVAEDKLLLVHDEIEGDCSCGYKGSYTYCRIADILREGT